MDRRILASTIVAFAFLVYTFANLAGGDIVGVNYGLLGDNLPTPDRTIALLGSRNIDRVRLFNPDPAVLAALRGSGISVIVGTDNQDLPALAADPSAALRWVHSNVAPFAASVRFRAIAAGNELIPGPLAGFVLPAIRNLAAALSAAGLAGIPVTTAVSTQVLGVSYPPSLGAFSEAAGPTMAPLVSHLASQRAPLMVNVYPYFAHAAAPQNVSLDYALFAAEEPAVRDGAAEYYNLFDAVVDSVYAAAERAVGGEVEVVVSETGWPAGGGPAATVENARKYNNGVVAHVRSCAGTPRKPGKRVETYLFALFNEDLKPAGTEQNFGLYRPDLSEVYHVDFGA